MAEEWRRIAATLADPTRRLVYASLILDVEVDVPGKKLAKALAALEAAGLINSDGVVNETIFAELLAQQPAVTRTGIDRFIREGRIEQYPAKPDDRARLLEWAAKQVIAPNEVLSESEINERLGKLTPDVATLRRYLVDTRLIVRDAAGTAYSTPTDIRDQRP